MNTSHILVLFVLGNVAFSFYAFDYISLFISSSDVTGVSVFLSVMGVIYAITAAFVIFEAASRMNSLTEEINKETIALRNLYSFVLLMEDDKLKEYARERIMNYCTAVKKRLYENDDKLKAESSRRFRELFSIPEKIAIKGRNVETKKILAGHIVNSLEASGEARARRRGLLGSSIPPIEIYLIIFLSLAIVTGFYFMGIANKPLFMFVVLVASAAVSAVMYIIFDLSNPFKGFWNISPEPYDRTLKLLEEK